MKTILFQGDSITDCGRLRQAPSNNIERLWFNFLKFKNKATPLGSGYASMVAKELGENYKYVNRGVGGDRVLDVYARIVRDIIKIKPDVMSLLVGVNDVWHGFDWNNGTGLKRFEKIFNILLDELKEELPDTKFIILGAFVLEGSATENRPGQPDRYAHFREGVAQVAAIEREAADKHGLKFVDLQSLFDEASKTAPAKTLLSDGVHPTENGHRLIMNEWIKAFKELD